MRHLLKAGRKPSPYMPTTSERVVDDDVQIFLDRQEVSQTFDRDQRAEDESFDRWGEE